MNEDPAARRVNPAGTASLIAGVLLLLAAVAAQSSIPTLPLILADAGPPYRTIPVIFAVSQAIIAAITTALGVIGLLVRDRARIPAVIGATLGASYLLVSIVGFLGTMLVDVTLG